MQTKKTIQKQSGPDKISISRIKQEMKEVYYLSDDLVILALDPNSPSLGRPVSLDGFAAIVMMSGEATLSINLNEYLVRPNDVVVFTPEVAINVVGYTEQASAYMIAFSKSFVNEIQIDLATSLPVYMRFGKDPVLHATSADVGEIRQVFQLIKTMLRSDKERYRHEIIRTLFTTAFYIITDLNQRERPANRPKGRGELIFEEFTSLLQRYNKRPAAQHHAQIPLLGRKGGERQDGCPLDRRVGDPRGQDPAEIFGHEHPGDRLQPQFQYAVLLRQVFQTAHRHLALALQAERVVFFRRRRTGRFTIGNSRFAIILRHPCCHVERRGFAPQSKHLDLTAHSPARITIVHAGPTVEIPRLRLRLRSE